MLLQKIRDGRRVDVPWKHLPRILLEILGWWLEEHNTARHDLRYHEQHHGCYSPVDWEENQFSLSKGPKRFRVPFDLWHLFHELQFALGGFTSPVAQVRSGVFLRALRPNDSTDPNHDKYRALPGCAFGLHREWMLPQKNPLPEVIPIWAQVRSNTEHGLCVLWIRFRAAFAFHLVPDTTSSVRYSRSDFASLLVQARPAARRYHDANVPQDTEVRSGADDILHGSNYLIQP